MRRRRALVGLALIVGLGSAAPSAGAAATPMVDLGSASSYAALSGASVGNTVSAPGAPHTTLRGDLGVKASAQPTGFPPGVVTGAFNVGNAAASQAHADASTAYAAIGARTGGAPLAGALAGTTVGPGLHTFVGAASNTTTVTLDAGGDPDAVFVFQVNGALAMAAGSNVVLTGGARASRVFWQVVGAGTIGATASFAGTLIARDAVGVGAGTVFNGRTIALGGALTLDANEVYSAPPVVTIDGGAAASTTDTTPTISGTTDVEAPAVVTVTVHGQTLTAVPSGGTWSVTSAILANATYPVVASVSDGAGNPGSATQQLTVDTVPPIVTLDGGASVTTNDATPTLSGTSDVTPGSIVRVSVGAQNLTALVQTGGTWNVTPAALADGTRTVTAEVTDPAGNPGTAEQTLTVDTLPPPTTITGGTTALTNDATPAITGTAAVEAGTTVTVTLADETLSGPVAGDGSWSVTASPLSDGPHRVVASVSDAAGNDASVTQTLTVDTVAPLVTIIGGATAATSDVAPTIRGTSDAASGTTVTVSLAGQTITTLVQADGTWNATPTPVGYGAWAISAAVPDPAGNVGRAGQLLTIAAAAPPEPVDPGGPVPPVIPGLPDGGATPVTPLTPVTPTPPVAPVVPSAPPAPGGAPTPATRATIARGDRQKLTGTSLSIGTKVTASRTGRIVATASGTVRIKGVKRATALTRSTAKIAAGKSTTLRLRLKGTGRTTRSAFKKLRTAVRTGKVVTATITLAIVDAAGNTRKARRTVTLVR
ncbi:MAG: Ig-like domain-containing protein [Patulibacter sp.]